MEFLTATTTYEVIKIGKDYVMQSAVTIYSLTDRALDLINFFSQLTTVSFGILFGILIFAVIIIIFKS